jgi:uncharacterized protein YkwD
VTTAVPAQFANRALAAITATMLVLAALVTGVVTAPTAGASTVENTFVDKLNHARTHRGIPALHLRPGLVKVARAQALRMATKDRLYHNPNLVTDVKNWRIVGENVGYGPTGQSCTARSCTAPSTRPTSSTATTPRSASARSP